jgi:hypothetical protein
MLNRDVDGVSRVYDRRVAQAVLKMRSCRGSGLMDSKRRLVRTTPNHAFESGRAVKRRATQRER